MNLVPWEIQSQFREEVLAERRRMRREGAWAWRVNLSSLAMLIVGIAQHVPLVSAWDTKKTRHAWIDYVAYAGWCLWRASGPLLFCGYAMSRPTIVMLGGGALALCFACLGVAAISKHGSYGPREARTLNAVFGGLATVTALVAVAGLVYAVFVASSVVFHSPAASMVSPRVLVFLAASACAVICLAGWVPSEWRPTHAIRSNPSGWESDPTHRLGSR
ncbi:MAG: hypothetical protein ACYTGZ_07730 [Planctomycetota bacterium]